MDKINFYIDNNKLDMYKSFLTENPLNRITEKFAKAESKFIDEAIKQLVPMWKLNLLLKINNAFIRKLLKVDIEIIKEELIGDFGWRIIVKNNTTNKYIARKFNINYG